MNVLIVGGGIAGLSLATALAQQGIDAEVVEREPEWTTVGAGITLYPNGMRALGALGLAGDVERAGFPVETVRTLTADGSLLSEFPGEEWPGVGRTLAVHRIPLQQVLLDAVGDAPVRLGVTVQTITAVENGVDVVLSDGTRARYDLVVGADGIRSRVRGMCFDASPPRYVGQTYWRTSVDAEIVDTATMMFADGRYVALLPLGGGKTFAAMQLQCAEPFSLPSNEIVRTVRERFSDFRGPAADALALLDADEVHFGPVDEIERDQWRSGRAVLVGDAAHACSPTLAQGGSLAFEDALVLAELLAAIDDTDAALDMFVARREPRARWVRERTRLHIEVLNDGAPELGAMLRETFDYLAQPI